MDRTVLAVCIALVLVLPSCRGKSRSSVAVDVAIGAEHRCAAFQDGSVRCWGKPGNGSRGEGIKLAAFPMELLSSSWLFTFFNEPAINQVVDLHDAIQLAAGGGHTCALRKGGRVSCWGNNSVGQLGASREEVQTLPYPLEVSGLGDVVQIVAGSRNTCVRKSDGSVWCWGDHGPLGTSFRSSSTPMAVPGLSGAVDLGATSELTCVLLANGSAWCWGKNDQGQLGDGNVGRPDPSEKGIRQVLGVRDGVRIAVAARHACVLTQAGEVLCWGSNKDGQMGDGTWGYEKVQPKPAPVAALQGAKEIYVAESATCGRLAERVVCVGGKGMIWEIRGVQVAKQIELARTFSYAGKAQTSGCAIMQNGALGCWGCSGPPSIRKRSDFETLLQVRW